jgi:cytidine deaminase
MQETIAGRPATDARRLWLMAKAAAANAYAPYSGLRVGAALQSVSGHTFTGVNVESASYPVGLCAERAARAAAVAAGERRFSALALATDSGAPLLPCGACLQALAEFGELDVIAAAPVRAADDASDAAPVRAPDGTSDAAPIHASDGASDAAELSVVALRDLLPSPFRLSSEDRR